MKTSLFAAVYYYFSFTYYYVGKAYVNFAENGKLSGCAC